MARTRLLKPAFFKDEDLAECEPLARLLFAGMWTVADCEGRLEDRPRRLKIEVLPCDNCDVDALLNQLFDHGLIVRYTTQQGQYIDIPGFARHQRPHPNEIARGSEIPPRPKSAPLKPNELEQKSRLVTISHEDSPSNPSFSLLPSPSNLSPCPSGQDARARDGVCKPTQTETLTARFNEWYSHYPKKEAKANALKAWKKLKPSDELTTQMIEAIEAQKAWYLGDKWADKKYIPQPATWLNGGRWEDEIAKQREQPGVYAGTEEMPF